MWLSLYILALAALAQHAPDVLWQPQVRDFVIVLAGLGAWRCGWGAVHLGRGLWYRHVVFPRWRRAADQSSAGGAASHVYIVIATSRIGGETTARVYQAAIAEAIRYACPATIVAGVGELADQRWIKRAFLQMRPPVGIRLAFVSPPASGKRHQMACSLRAVSRMRPARDAAVVLLDGDVLMPAGSLARSLPFLKLMPEVDAILTDEEGIVAGGPAMHAWRRLRVARRHQTMSSLGLSRRLPGITGGMSIHPAGAATEPSFIAALERGQLEHARRGGRMLYLPDVRTVRIERPPAKRPLSVTARLILRGVDDGPAGRNTAIALGPARIGLFTWCCLIEQRVSLWTPLIGLVIALAFALKSVLFLYAYLLWVGTTRLIHALLLLTARPTISGLYPPVIYFAQIYGALIAACGVSRLGRQSWPRQPRSTSPLLAWRAHLQALRPAHLHVLALGVLTVAAAFGVWSPRLLPLL
jgi:glycosyltransferase Alg8